MRSSQLLAELQASAASLDLIVRALRSDAELGLGRGAGTGAGGGGVLGGGGMVLPIDPQSSVRLQFNTNSRSNKKRNKDFKIVYLALVLKYSDGR